MGRHLVVRTLPALGAMGFRFVAAGLIMAAIYRALLESTASEHGARMSAMRSATAWQANTGSAAIRCGPAMRVWRATHGAASSATPRTFYRHSARAGRLFLGTIRKMGGGLEMRTVAAPDSSAPAVPVPVVR